MNSTLNTLLQDKIVQLENGLTVDEEEDRLLAKELVKAKSHLETQLTKEENLKEGASMVLLKEKYFTLFEQKFRLEYDQAKMVRKVDQMKREQDALKLDLTKVTELKGKLENLCRELQRENKRVKKAYVSPKKNKKKRLEMSGKFESAIEDIRVKMDEESEENRKRAEDNAMLKEKFKSFLEQFELREQHHNSIVKSKNLEIQLLDAKINQHKETTEQEMMKTQSLAAELNDSIKRENELREQLVMYVEKFKQVEETLSQSNEIFTNFRQEMEQMRKKTKKYEKENLTIKQKCDKMNQIILGMVDEKAKTQSDLTASNKKIGQLENLCRALQTERNAFQKKLELLKTSQEEISPSTNESTHTLKGLLQKKAEFLRLSQALADERETIKSQLNPHLSTSNTPSNGSTEEEQPALDVGPAYVSAQETLKDLCNIIEEISL